MSSPRPTAPPGVPDDPALAAFGTELRASLQANERIALRGAVIQWRP
jgi:hypothetical protein